MLDIYRRQLKRTRWEKKKSDIVVVTEPAAFRRQLGLNDGTRVLANAKEGCSVWMNATEEDSSGFS